MSRGFVGGIDCGEGLRSRGLCSIVGFDSMRDADFGKDVRIVVAVPALVRAGGSGFGRGGVLRLRGTEGEGVNRCE